MSLTKDDMSAFQAKYISNSRLEWLIECGNIQEIVYFKGATGDRYSIYIAIKRSKSKIDLYNINNTYSHNVEKGNHIATIENYVLRIVGKSVDYWHGDNCGYVMRQLIRKGIQPKNHQKQWTVRFCRSTHFMRMFDKTEFSPWIGMKVDLKTGKLLNKPNKKSLLAYNNAKDFDRSRRKANRIANKNNADALVRYHEAKGNFALLPIDDIFKHRNVEYRTDILNFHGLEKVLSTLETKVEDEDTIDGRFYRLLNVKIPDNAFGREGFSWEWGLYLEMINPSTGESHFEGIANVTNNPDFGNNNSIDEPTVKAALSWRDGDGIMQTDGNAWSSRSTTDNYVIPTRLT